MGFEFEAFQGLETGNREVASHVINRDGVRLVFKSTLQPKDEEFSRYLARHGDGIKDIALEVKDVEKIYKKAVANGAVSIKEPHTVKDKNG